MIKDFFVVTKFILSFAVSLSALFAYIMAKGEIGLDMFLATFSVLLVAMGVSTLNQVQEYREDSKMERTKNRPIAAGRMSPRTGTIIAVVLILISLAFIYSLLGITGINFFAFAFIWYNLMYTPMKKRSALAVVPGAILGVIPPAIGWLVAGHTLFELEFIALAVYYFIWQVPHFWLLVMLFHGDYKDGGYPTAMRLFGEGTLQRLTFVWLMLTIQAGVFMVYTFNVYSNITIALSIAFGVWAFMTSIKLLKKEFHLTDARSIFWKINAAFLGIIILLSIDEYIKHHL
ncbi:MAG: protoheme IX farnesyltransferase [Sulfurovum sp.]|uniref:protoheme IX farnesyltransferase n=1 Tax=Sulfurovum sp. TaxID=1969726 RepID=UPI002867C8E1|nr:protoheme IX farnesyltransferase [Sulfurovum sp.]MCO4844653.1 protoheme IX farnesyltransferase [Sulfurovum sp.]